MSELYSIFHPTEREKKGTNSEIYLFISKYISVEIKLCLLSKKHWKFYQTLILSFRHENRFKNYFVCPSKLLIKALVHN